jgi:hypothetical protein
MTSTIGYVTLWILVEMYQNFKRNVPPLFPGTMYSACLYGLLFDSTFLRNVGNFYQTTRRHITKDSTLLQLYQYNQQYWEQRNMGKTEEFKRLAPSN